MKTPLPLIPELRDRPGKAPLVVDIEGRAPIKDTAEYFDLRVSQLCGLIGRSEIYDPLGNLSEGTCYAWAVERYLDQQSRTGQGEKA